MKSLQALMQEKLAEGGVMVGGGRDPHIEVIEVATGRVWMSVEPATQQDYDALLEGLDESLRPIGIGSAAMDAALFQFNPNTGGSILLDPAIKFREIPTTGSTYLAYSPGIMVNVFNFASAYFIAQIPIHRDFNGNLEQQISYIFGVTKSFQLLGGSS